MGSGSTLIMYWSQVRILAGPPEQAIVNKITEINKQYESKRELAFKFGRQYKDKFNKISIAKNILSIKK